MSHDLLRSIRPVSWIPVVLVLTAASPLLGSVPFVRGDSNGDGLNDIADPVSTLHFLFLGDRRPPCADAADSNDDGRVDPSDVVQGLGFLFLAGSPPAAPFPGCGQDPTADALSCDSYGPCAPQMPENIRFVLGDCGGIPRTPYPNSLTPGSDLHRVTVSSDPLAVCNDGSPAVYYVKPADPEGRSRDRWIIYLQGGGGCLGFDDCTERWCGGGFYDASKMSSAFTPESIGGTGIFAAHAENRFADWNHVFVYYCSSDSWSGQRSDAVLEDPDDPDSAYSLHFRGHSIVAAVVRELFEGDVASDDGEFVLPPLSEASFVLFAGTSAGGGGVRNNGDWFAGLFDPERTTVRLLIDAGVAPDVELHPDPTVAADLALQENEVYAEHWQAGVFEDLRNAFLDESCLEYWSARGEPWRCVSPSFVARHHITTPYFTRTDLRDRNSLHEMLGTELATYAALSRATLESLDELSSTAIEADGIDWTPGVFGPNCGDHTGLMVNFRFHQATVADAAGIEWTFHDALREWLAGNDVSIVNELRSPSATCDPEDTDLE